MDTLEIIKLISDTLNCQCLHTRARTAVGRKYAQRVGRLRLHFLSAVAGSVYIANIIACRVQSGVGRLES